MARAAVASIFTAVVLGSGCGGQGADDIARGIDDAIRAARPKPEIRAPDAPAPELRAVPEEETESASKRAVCNGLDAYSADASQSLSDHIRQAAERELVLANYDLNEVDPEEADRLANAASDINDSQEAGEVVSALGCN